MTRRAKTPKQQPIVDDADVQMLADLFLPTSQPTVSDDETVKLAEKAARSTVSDEEVVKLAEKAARL